MNAAEWYSTLIKPAFAPPAWVFGPVWAVLYAIIAVTFFWVFYLAYKKKIPGVVVIPFIFNLIFNLLFSPIQFGLQNNYLATIDIILVLGTLAWAMLAIFPYSRAITYAQVPYLAWVSFATTLQIAITWLNR